MNNIENLQIFSKSIRNLKFHSFLFHYIDEGRIETNWDKGPIESVQPKFEPN